MHVWWPNIDRDLEMLMPYCAACQPTKSFAISDSSTGMADAAVAMDESEWMSHSHGFILLDHLMVKCMVYFGGRPLRIARSRKVA